MQFALSDTVQHLLLPLYNQYGWGVPDPIDSTIMGPKISHKQKKVPGIRDTQHAAMQEKFFEIAGVYFYKGYAQEGEIILYNDQISTAGLSYYELTGRVIGKYQSSCITMVEEIVLWHQLGHWIIHWMQGKDRSRWNTGSYRYDERTKDE